MPLRECPLDAVQPQNWPQSKEGPSATPTVDGDRLYVVGIFDSKRRRKKPRLDGMDTMDWHLVERGGGGRRSGNVRQRLSQK